MAGLIMRHHPLRPTVSVSPSHRPVPPVTGTAEPGHDPLPPGPIAGYQRLAIRVIQQALHDLECASPSLRESARVFLDGGPLLCLWCDVADIGPARVMARAAMTHFGGADRPGRHGRPYDASTPIARLATASASVS